MVQRRYRRGVDSIVLDREVARFLRDELQQDPDRLAKALDEIEQTHQHLPETLRLEEKLIRVVLQGGGSADIESILQPALRTLYSGGNAARNLAHWALRALPEAPPEVRATEAAQAMALLALTYVGRRRLLPEDRYQSASLARIAWALPASLMGDQGEICVELMADGLRFAPPSAANILRLPKTTPMLVEATWTDRGVTQSAVLEAAPGKRYDLWSDASSVVLRTLAGDEYRLEPTREPSDAPGQNASRPICYVVMGFGKKIDLPTGRELDLDKSYQTIIRPAAIAAGYECIRADEILSSGVLDAPLYDRLYSADLVIADLSTGNLSAVFQLGVRLALRPRTTVVIAESSFQFPFDYFSLELLRYEHFGPDINEKEALRTRAELIERIKNAKDVDSPVYRLLPELLPPTRVYSSLESAPPPAE